jgi:hypothetical protein
VLHAALTSKRKLIPIRLAFGPEKQALTYQFSEQRALMGDLSAGLQPAAITTLETLALAPVQVLNHTNFTF